MTSLSLKNKLFATLEEYDAVQRTANRKRSEMHRIIAALPDGETPDDKKPEGVDIPLAADENGQTISSLQESKERGYQTIHSWPEERRFNASNRPVLNSAAVPPSATDSPNADFQVPAQRSVEKERPKKARAKRTCEADIRKAVKLVYDENISQKEAEQKCHLPQGTLSKSKGKEIMAEYRKRWGTPTMINSQRGVSRKELEKSFLHEDK